jgi:Na+-transporting methylmalonyl-CoA/oxaloacetate decarboxylase gamma subunit
MLITDMNIMTMGVITIVFICLTVLRLVLVAVEAISRSEDTQSNDAE